MRYGLAASIFGNGVAASDGKYPDSQIHAELLDEAAQGEESDGEVRALKRTLSALNLVALGVGGIIGAGIFVLTGHAAAANAGPAGPPSSDSS